MVEIVCSLCNMPLAVSMENKAEWSAAKIIGHYEEFHPSVQCK